MKDDVYCAVERRSLPIATASGALLARLRRHSTDHPPRAPVAHDGLGVNTGGTTPMHVSYEAVIIPNDFGGYRVECPDLRPGVSWPASSEPEAAAVAASVIAYHVCCCVRNNETLPQTLYGHEAPAGGLVMSISVDLDSQEGLLPGYCTVAAAAEMLNVSTSRIRALARAGRLESRKHGGLWFISTDSVKDRIEHPRKPGRPSKHAATCPAGMYGTNDLLED